MKDRQDKAGLWTREEANAALYGYGRHHMMQNGNGRNKRNEKKPKPPQPHTHHMIIHDS